MGSAMSAEAEAGGVCAVRRAGGVPFNALATSRRVAVYGLAVGRDVRRGQGDRSGVVGARGLQPRRTVGTAGFSVARDGRRGEEVAAHIGHGPSRLRGLEVVG